jgi:hypothetical protein
MDQRTTRKKKDTTTKSNLDTTTTLAFKIARKPKPISHDHSFETRAVMAVNPINYTSSQFPNDEGNPMNDETPSRIYGGVPMAVLNCNFGRIESREYYGNNYHQENGLLYLISEAFYAGRKSAKDISPEDLEMFMSLSLLVKKLSTDNCDVL